MYKELIQRLRNCATQPAPCNTCDLAEDGSCSDTQMKQAADAIEELSRQCKQLQYMPPPAWISVTEALPKEAYGCLAIVWDNNPYSGDTFLNYYPEFVGYGGGSWNDYNGDEKMYNT